MFCPWCVWYARSLSDVLQDEYDDCHHGPCDLSTFELCLPDGADCDD